MWTAGASAALFYGPALLAWLLGDSMRWRRGYYRALEERAARLEAEMQSHRCLAGLLVLGIVVAAGHAQRTSGQTASETAAPPVSGRVRPADVHPETGNRFPPIRRDTLNEAEKKLYDTRGVTDGFGPAALRLYSPPVA